MRMKIGEVLVEAGLITGEQLENALLIRKGKNKRLGKVLIEMGYVNEDQIAAALAKQLSLPLIDCSKFTISKDLLNVINKEIAESKTVLPLQLKDKKLFLAMADPLDWQALDDISFKTGLAVEVAVCSESNILLAIEKYYGTEEKSFDLIKELPTYEGVEFVKGVAEVVPEKEGTAEKELNVQSLYKLSEAPPIVRLVTMILVDAVKARTSDIHIEPHENHVLVRYRIDGNLRNILKLPKHIQDSVVSRIKIISNLDITNRRLPQDGRSTLKYENRNIDLRLSTLPSVYGEKIVIRLLDQSKGLIPLGKLGMEDGLLKSLIYICSQSQGMLLVTGPTGSGKTTTLYSILKELQTESENIITIEDPVEYRLEGINQVSVNEAIGLSFSKVLRSILRQDPDIIMVGEIRDRETAEIAARSALTGHFVLSTLHTNDTVSTIARLLDIGLEPFLVGSAISGILAQRLVRKICDKCKEEVPPPVEAIEGKYPQLKSCFKGKGCVECQYSGYLGQISIYEFLTIDTKLKRLITREATEDDLWNAARESGMKTLFENAWVKVSEGLTTVEEVISKIPFKQSIVEMQTIKGEGRQKVLAFNITGMEADSVRRFLEPEGYDIIDTAGDNILEHAMRESPDIILMDASTDIFTTMKRIRGEIRYTFTPVFVISDMTDKDKETERIKSGVKGIIYRPIDNEKILFMLKSTYN